MKLLSIMWSTYVPLLKQAAAETGLFQLRAWSIKQLAMEMQVLGEVKRELKNADMILLYRTADGFWDSIEEEVKNLGGRIPVVAIGPDPSHWRISTVSPEVAAVTYRYILYNGLENFVEMLKYLLSTVFLQPVPFKAPKEVVWEGIYHADWGGPYSDTGSFLDVYPMARQPLVGLLYPRSNWVTGNIEVERSLTSALERRGLGVVSLFYYSLKDASLGNLGGEDVVRKFLLRENGASLVEALVKLSVFFLGQKGGEMGESQADGGVRLLKGMNVPLFHPVLSYYREKEDWLRDRTGLGQQVAWSMAMPEFEGAIEPLIVGAARGISRPEEESYEPIEDRVERLAARIKRWVDLRLKPNSEKKVAFILHNNPCASLEATVGAGAHLDTLESVARILNAMRLEGYAVEPPSTGKELIDDILERKALSEFRWTTTSEIVNKGGCLRLLEADEYLPWFMELPEETRRRMAETWGAPPGEEKDGIPAAMVHDGRILITGVRYGNAVVCVQPKRGCAGARCDGQVCRILHDPDVPPPHQYIATYKWLSREFGADAVIHVGTHGNLEFLPGKSTGLSSGCFPDAAVDEMPHLYIYNADNAPEGTTAKRRGYAALVDHLQAVMVQGELYGDLDEIEKLLAEYDKLKHVERGKAHTISHMIEDRLKAGNLLPLLEAPEDAPFDRKARAIHEALALLRNTHIPKGMHIFGKLPEGDALLDFIYAVVRYDATPRSLRGLVTCLVAADPSLADLDEEGRKNLADDRAREACRRFLMDGIPIGQGLGEHFAGVNADDAVYGEIEQGICDVRTKVLLSDETASFLNGLNGGYIPPGPSGIVTRGGVDILPTGRNFYSLDPRKVPSRVGWETGVQLAAKTLDKFIAEEGRCPENIAFYWQCTDIMWSDGEGMAQMLYLLGVKPVWASNGRTNGFEIIPLAELGRPRIDVTVRVSGITRDNFASCIETLDEAVLAVASLEEPVESNFVRKHLLEELRENAASPTDMEAFRKAAFRIFCSMPGVYQAGTQLAVYASAWKDESDLSDVFLQWNGFAYGKGVFGEPARSALERSLGAVDLTFGKTVTDEYDLLGCCCHFGTHGGMINAAKVLSGKEIRTYYGDTREQGEVAVRDLAGEIQRVARAKLLNPRWIEGMKEHGYKGAGEIGKRVGRVYGWEATTQEVDDGIFDDIARTFLMDEENRKFFEENNPYALEEMARRLIEAAGRGLWKPSPEIQEALKEIYILIEGWIEERAGDLEGDYQGGSIDVVTRREVENWKGKMTKTVVRKD